MLELARAFKALNPAPKRTVIFFWPTAEEKGLLGARYYVDHPLYPLAATVANINLDYFSNWGWGPTRDFSIVGLGNSTLDDLTAEAVARQGRVLTGDTAPSRASTVPITTNSPAAAPARNQPRHRLRRQTSRLRRDETHRLHPRRLPQASDVIKPDWDLSGAVEDLQNLLEVGYRVAQNPGRPAGSRMPSGVRAVTAAGALSASSAG